MEDNGTWVIRRGFRILSGRGGPIIDAVLSRGTLEYKIPESKKENWVGTHSMVHGLVGLMGGGFAGGLTGAALGALIHKNPEFGSGLSGLGLLAGGVYGNKMGRKYHLQHSSDFRED